MNEAYDFFKAFIHIYMFEAEHLFVKNNWHLHDIYGHSSFLIAFLKSKYWTSNLRLNWYYSSESHTSMIC